jgi:hypothetical protein
VSYRIVGHDSNGHRIVVDEGPNLARVSERGGLTLGMVLTSIPPPAPRTADPNAARKRRYGLRGESVLARKCGAVLPFAQLPCASPGGHRDHHRSAAKT